MLGQPNLITIYYNTLQICVALTLAFTVYGLAVILRGSDMACFSSDIVISIIRMILAHDPHQSFFCNDIIPVETRASNA